MKFSSVSRSASVRSATATFIRNLGACFLKFAAHDRYFGLVHGSTAPWSTDSDGFGITRFISKSMVLPNPWQRGHAPNGELKLNRIGSGSANSRSHVLH